jgi:nitroimidazol reductase NimA-like FMN-containing flavoprotein (pyridoxamine 5'-phosphate oxidase superfamily)
LSDGDPGAAARAVIDSNSYMTLGTADAGGLPWVTPVWFAHSGYREFLWVSSPETRHSRNLEARPEVSIVIFDSQVSPGDAEAVYVSAKAEELSGDELESGIEVFSRKSESAGLPPYSRVDVQEPASLRLYRAVATEHFALGEGSRRISSTRARAGANRR